MAALGWLDFVRGGFRLQKWASQCTRQKLYHLYDLLWEVTWHHFWSVLAEVVIRLLRFKERRERPHPSMREVSLNFVVLFFLNHHRNNFLLSSMTSLFSVRSLCLAKLRMLMSKQCWTWSGFDREQAFLLFVEEKCLNFKKLLGSSSVCKAPKHLRAMLKIL